MSDSTQAVISYTDEEPIDADQFIALLRRSGLAERRPVEERPRIASMVLNADILMTAWDGNELVGVARSVTDFAYCCYLSDLAVDADYQNRGIGKALIRHTAALLASDCQIILLSAPAAQEYYPALGFVQHDSAWCGPASTFIR
ncbi:MAG: GNAT family N-acetyltransferase [Pseudomonadota bacterium]